MSSFIDDSISLIIVSWFILIIVIIMFLLLVCLFVCLFVCRVIGISDPDDVGALGYS